MPRFNTQQEIWAHLVNGGAVTDVRTDKVYKFIDGELVLYFNETSYELSTCGFITPTFFSVVKNWYDEIANRQILCWVSDIDPTKKAAVALIGDYVTGSTYPFRATHDMVAWEYATPLNEDDIESYFYRK